MKNTLHKFRDGLVFGIGFLVILSAANAWTGLQAESGDTLTHTKWNELVDKVDGIFTDGSGNIGIGTNSPDSQFHSYSDGFNSLKVESDTNSSVIAVDGKSNYGSYLRLMKEGNVEWDILSNSSVDFSIEYRTDPKFYIKKTGNIGIGTTNPTRELHISDPTGGQIMLEGTGNTDWNGIDLKAGNGLFNGYFGMKDSNGQFFIDAGSNGNDLVINQNGNIGIGTNSPNTKLDVLGDIKSTKAIAATSWSGLSIATGRTLYMVMLSNNYNTGDSVRSCIYHVLTNNEGTGVSFSSQVSSLNGCSSQFRVSNGYLQAYPDQTGNWTVGVYRN